MKNFTYDKIKNCVLLAVSVLILTGILFCMTSCTARTAKADSYSVNAQSSDEIDSEKEKSREEMISLIYPADEYYPRSIFNLNGNTDDDNVNRLISVNNISGRYSGFIPKISFATTPEYASEDFVAKYGRILEAANNANVKITFSGDVSVPDGYAGGKLKEEASDSLLQRLYYEEYTLSPGSYKKISLPEGKLMSAVGYNPSTRTLQNLKDFVINGEYIEIQAPSEGTGWKVLIFTCREDTSSSSRSLVNYLSPKAVNTYFDYTYNRFFNAYPEYFGTVIDSLYFSDIGFYYVEDCLVWSDDFNIIFTEKYGFEPDILYASLLYDVDDTTPYARNIMYSLRAELLSEGFPKQVTEWAHSHNMISLGNCLSFNSVVPTGICGDYMKFYRYVDIPMIKEMNYLGYAKKYYKLLSSLRDNYGQKLTGASFFEDFAGLTVEEMYESLMYAYVRGINYTITDGIYLDTDSADTDDANLSAEDSAFSFIGDFNEFSSRLQNLMQKGSHVCDIAVIYPIESLNAMYNLNYVTQTGKATVSREDIPFADYLDIGEWLFDDINVDYTYIHPEAVCADDFEFTYKIVILPGSTVVSVKLLEKLRDFYNNGGIVISTYSLPTYSSEEGQNSDVFNLCNEIFGIGSSTNLSEGKIFRSTNKNGGKSFVITSYKYNTVDYAKNMDLLKSVIDEVLTIRDVALSNSLPLYNGEITYTHNRDGETDIYYLVNSSSEDYSEWINIRGMINPIIFDPYTGESYVPEYIRTKQHLQDITQVKISIPSKKSVFIIGSSHTEVCTIPVIYDDATSDISPENFWIISKDYVEGYTGISDNQIEITNSNVLSSLQKISSDFIVEFDLLIGDAASGGIIIGYTDSNNYIYLEFTDSGFTIYSVKDGTKTVHSETETEFKLNVTHRIRVIVHNSEVAVYSGNNLVTKTEIADYTYGNIGFMSVGRILVSNVSVLGAAEYKNSATGNYVAIVCFILIIISTVVFEGKKRIENDKRRKNTN